MSKVLNIGGNSKAIPLPGQYIGFEHILLDVDPGVHPDILCDARDLLTLEAGSFDAVYCSHNLEHYYWHEVPKVLAGIRSVLREGGFVHLLVPDIQSVMQTVVEKGLEPEAVLYQSPAGPIMVLDVLYGYTVELERSGSPYFAHKTGFSLNSLHRKLLEASFSKVFGVTRNHEISMVAFKVAPDPAFCALFNVSPD